MYIGRQTRSSSMICPHCGRSASPLDDHCAGCGARLEVDLFSAASGLRAPTGIAATGLASTGARPGGTGPLTIGQNFGSRYHIIRLLGIGGMGAVYQAWDQVLEVAVALKVIRPDSMADPTMAQDVERRFRRELLLARQVTHKNVVRIHDLGEIDGITYITMPYVQGSDLATILRRDGRLPVERALAIAKEVAAGLAAAHAADVVHRDLKPANIMIDGEGLALIMDFGIARSTSGATGIGMTATGTLAGTIEYMAPEQARGEAADQRADVYSFALILNDMLLGRRQGNATGMTELLTRMQQAPAALRSIDPTIPRAVDALVTKCLQPDPASRPQTMHEVIAELDGLDLHGAPTLLPGSMPALPHRSPRRTAIVAASVVMVIALGGWTVGSRWLQRRSQVVAGPPVSLAILPFRNASGDATLDSLGSSVSEVLRTEVGQSARVRTVPSDRVHQVLQDLRIAPNATLTPADVTRAAEFTSAGSVLWGQVTRFGSAIRIDATLQDLDRQQTIPLNARAPNEEGLLAAISQLAEVVRQNLARGSTEVLNDLKSTSWKPSTASFEAVRLYNEGAQLTRDGKPQEALKRFEESTTQDHSFALAFSALARSYATLGRDIEAAQSSGRAMSLAEALPPQEKYLISANHYRIANDTTKAIESYEHLVAASANDATVQFDVGELYEQSGDYEQARQHFAKVVELDPKLAQGLLALGRVEIRGGHPQDSLDHLTRALTLAIQVNNDEARANILHAIGVAYKRLNRPNEALPQFKESLALKERLGDRRGMAASLGEIGQLQQTQGKMPDAKQSYQDALKLQRAIGSTSGTAESLINLAVLFNDHLGRPDDALPLLQEALLIRRTGGNKNAEALVLNNIGNVYLAKGQYSDAQTNFERALELREKANVPREIADTLHDLAETLLKMGHYDQSLTQYHRALDLRRTSGDRRAEAIERYSMGTVFDYQASYGKAVQSKEEALGTFRDLKGRDMWLGEILGGYGNSLSLSGQMDQATTHLDEAMTVANELQNATLVAQTRRFQADRLYYSGDVKGASRVAEQALKDATSAADRSLALQARSAVAITAASIRPTQGLASQLATLARDADTLGLRFLSVDCSIQRAVTLLKLGDRVNARQEVERSLARAETLGSRLLLAKAHYVRAAALGPGHDADARVDYTSALRLLEDIKREEGNQHVLMRADLSAMYEECLAKSKGT